MTLHAADLADAGEPFGTEASMAKLAASEAASFAANAAVMTLGSYGYSREYPVEKWLRDAKLEEIYEGTSDIQRLIIARSMFPPLSTCVPVRRSPVRELRVPAGGRIIPPALAGRPRPGPVWTGTRKGGSMASTEGSASQADLDTADLERFGYKQELKRDLGTFSSFAVAFSYISPSTGIFTLFFLGISALGARMFWTWPVVAMFQLIVALNFAEVTSHFPLGRLGLPVDEVPRGPWLRLDHRLVLPVRGDPDRGVGLRDAADRPDPGAQQRLRVEPEQDAVQRRSQGRSR